MRSFRSFPGKMMQPGMQLQVLGNGQIPVEAEVLLDYAELRLHLGRIFCHINAVDPEPARMMGLVRVVRMRMVVVLPAPFGPKKPKSSPWLDLQIQAVNHFFAGIVLVQARYLNHLAHKCRLCKCDTHIIISEFMSVRHTSSMYCLE